MANRTQDLIHIQNCLKNFLRDHLTSKEEKEMVEKVMLQVRSLKK